MNLKLELHPVPEFNTETPRASLTIGAQTYQIPLLFNAGYTLNDNEAAQMNQVLKENVGNNLRGRIDKATKEGKPVPTQDEVDEYVRGYEFGVRLGGVRITDPVEREARDIAKVLVRDKLKTLNIKLSSVSPEKMEEYVSKLAAQENIRAEAETRVGRAKKLTEVELDLGDAVNDADESETSAAA